MLRLCLASALVLTACSSDHRRDPGAQTKGASSTQEASGEAPTLEASGEAATAQAVEPSAPTPDAPALARPGKIPAEPQRPGDPAAGYRALVNQNYIGCGVPYSIYESIFGSWPRRFRLPDRPGRNAELPYFLTAYQKADGVEVVTANCLACHADFLNGSLVIGLGASRLDFSMDPSPPLEVAGLLLKGAERDEWRRFADRVKAISAHLRTRTMGANPGDAIAAALFAHRDRETLAWSQEPLMDLPPAVEVPVDVPPWWRMNKKHAMFYTAAGRGDHARIMMTASALCTDSVEQARQIDAYFPDIRAYIASLTPPPWPYSIDQERAASGQTVFRRKCQRCHGSYGAKPSYPNKVISLSKVGTDPLLADGTGQFASSFVTWFNESFYGEIARMEPAAGYIAPPLDGIWATAPYLHNGAVPTLAALLDSRQRPTYWTRSYGDSDYDTEAMGWRTTALERAPTERTLAVVDTTLPGYGKGGHTFGDKLSAEERAALLEYLKTL